MVHIHWSEAVQLCHRKGEAYALITILGCSGSTPRDQTSKMVVTQECTYDSIGGGSLEFTVTTTAREKLARNETSAEVIPLPLGGALGQCCGGFVTVLIETFSACDFKIVLFGAGHVAQALVKIIGELPCQVSWVDNRIDVLSPAEVEQLPPNITFHGNEEPINMLGQLPIGSHLLIMTHDHPLDYALVAAALQRNQLEESTFPYIGLIGSETKAERFRYRLMADGFSEAALANIECPVGLSAVPGKRPMEVAVSIAAQLIALHHNDASKPVKRGLAWRDIKNNFTETENSDAII